MNSTNIVYKCVSTLELNEAVSFTLDAMFESHRIFLTDYEFNRDIISKQETIISRLKESSTDKEKYFGIAKKNEQIVGAISCRILDDTVFIDYVYVDKQCRGMGIGTELIHTCLKEVCKFKNISKIQLQVYASNVKAINAYIKQGFKKISEKQKENTVFWIMEFIMSIF